MLCESNTKLHVTQSLLFLEHEIVRQQKFTTSNILNSYVVEEANESCNQTNKKAQCPFEDNILKYLDLSSGPPVLHEKVILNNPVTNVKKKKE